MFHHLKPSPSANPYDSFCSHNAVSYRGCHLLSCLSFLIVGYRTRCEFWGWDQVGLSSSFFWSLGRRTSADPPWRLPPPANERFKSTEQLSPMGTHSALHTSTLSQDFPQFILSYADSHLSGKNLFIDHQIDVMMLCSVLDGVLECTFWGIFRRPVWLDYSSETPRKRVVSQPLWNWCTDSEIRLIMESVCCRIGSSQIHPCCNPDEFSILAISTLREFWGNIHNRIQSEQLSNRGSTIAYSYQPKA